MTAARSRARSGPAVASAPPATTSTRCSMRCIRWRRAHRRRCPMCKTTSRATSGPKVVSPGGAPRTARQVLRARGDERTRPSSPLRPPGARRRRPRTGRVRAAGRRRHGRQRVRPRRGLGGNGRVGDTARHGRDPDRPLSPPRRNEGGGRQPSLRPGLRRQRVVAGRDPRGRPAARHRHGDPCRDPPGRRGRRTGRRRGGPRGHERKRNCAGGEPRLEQRDAGRPRHISRRHAHRGGPRACRRSRLGGNVGRRHRVRGQFREQHGDAH